MNHTVNRTTDIVFAEVAETKLMLNLYRPARSGPIPAVLYLHGGGWQRGDRLMDVDARVLGMAAAGLAVATIDYRLAPEWAYPAQVHDVKAAVRWLRGRGSEFGLATERIGVWGASAGAMLGSLAALTPGDRELEGDLGEHRDESSRIDAVAYWFGTSDFVTRASRSPMEAQILPPPVETVLWNEEDPDARAELARSASPIERIRPDAPPFLIVHGDRDRLIPLRESELFHESLARAGVETSFLRLGAAGHEDPRFNGAAVLGATASFLLAALDGRPGDA